MKKKIVPSKELLKSIKSDIESGTIKTSEYSDFIIMKEVWKCPPTIFEEQEEYMINLHKSIINMENRHQYLQQKRQFQKSKI